MQWQHWDVSVPGAAAKLDAAVRSASAHNALPYHPNVMECYQVHVVKGTNVEDAAVAAMNSLAIDATKDALQSAPHDVKLITVMELGHCAQLRNTCVSQWILRHSAIRLWQRSKTDLLGICDGNVACGFIWL